MSAYDIPLAPEELRSLADLLDKLSDLLMKDGVYVAPLNGDFNEEIEIGDVSIEIKRTGSNSVIGYAALDDGWIGFRPKQDDLRLFLPKNE